LEFMERKGGAEAVRSALCATDLTEWKSAPVQTDAVETRDDIYTHGTLWWPKEHNQGMVRAEENENDIGMGRGDSGVLPRANEMSRQPPSLDGSWAERGLEREVGRGAMGADGSGVP